MHTYGPTPEYPTETDDESLIKYVEALSAATFDAQFAGLLRLYKDGHMSVKAFGRCLAQGLEAFMYNEESDRMEKELREILGDDAYEAEYAKARAALRNKNRSLN